jgi:anti-anti-sigma factor
MDYIGIVKTEVDEGVELALSGELLFLDCHDFMRDAPMYSEDKGPKLILNMEKLKFIDSAGLGALLYISEALRMKGRRLVIRNASENNLKLIRKIQNVGTFSIE